LISVTFSYSTAEQVAAVLAAKGRIAAAATVRAHRALEIALRRIFALRACDAAY